MSPVFASSFEQNSRTRFTGANVSSLAPKNVRHLRMYAHCFLTASENLWIARSFCLKEELSMNVVR